jgi:hypothetical protein
MKFICFDKRQAFKAAKPSTVALEKRTGKSACPTENSQCH